MGSIQLEDVTKQYGSLRALSEITLTIETSGGIHCIVGPNGSGKSTLFNLIAGLEQPTSGTITTDNVSVGVAFQRPSMYPSLSVAENLSVFSHIGGTTVEELEQAEIESALGLDVVRDQPADELSGGLQKKLDLALAAVTNPDVLLLDEPIAELDEVTQHRLLDFLETYRSPERSICIATHHLRYFESILDRLTILDEGELQFNATVDSIEDASVGDYHQFYVDMLA